MSCSEWRIDELILLGGVTGNKPDCRQLLDQRGIPQVRFNVVTLTEERVSGENGKRERCTYHFKHKMKNVLWPVFEDPPVPCA